MDPAFDVGIVGAGLAGLTCAVALVQRGLRVLVLERDSVLGGRACSWVDQTTGDAISIGPHILLSEYPNMLKLLRILNTEQRVVWQRRNFITMVSGRQLIEMNMGVAPAPFHFVPSLLADQTLRNRDWLSNVPITLYAVSITERDLLRFDSQPALDLLRRFRVTPEYIRRFWAFIALAILNVPLERCSAASILRFYRRLIGQRGYRVGFADGGLGDLFVPAAERFITSAGSLLLRDTGVSEIGSADGGYELRCRNGNTFVVARCVAAIPPQSLAAILPKEWLVSIEAKNLTRFESSPYISVYLWFDRKLTDLKFWSRIYRAQDWNLDFYDLSNIYRGWRDRPSLIASNIIYSERLGEVSEDQVVSRTLRELAEFLPAAAEAHVRHSVVNRIPMAVPAAVPGWEHLRPQDARLRPGLVLAGDWLQTGLPASMESACYSGWRAAERIFEELGAPQRLVVPHKELALSAWSLGRAVKLIARMTVH